MTSAFMLTVFAEFGIVTEWLEFVADGWKFCWIAKLPRIADTSFWPCGFIVRLEVVMLFGG